MGIEVLEAIKELGEGLIKLSDVEAVSKTGQRKRISPILKTDLPIY